MPVRLLVEAAHKLGLTLYLVGGPVRDWLLERKVADIDLLIAGGSEETPELLARKVAELAESGASDFQVLYPDEMPLWDKVQTIAQKIYGADDINAERILTERFKQLQAQGYGHLPICVAKTQYSFSNDPNLKGAPSGHVVPVREVRLSAGAGFVVVVCGEIMTMPGLPRVPSAHAIHLNKDGVIEGLF